MKEDLGGDMGFILMNNPFREHDQFNILEVLI